MFIFFFSQTDEITYSHSYNNPFFPLSLFRTSKCNVLKLALSVLVSLLLTSSVQSQTCMNHTFTDNKVFFTSTGPTTRPQPSWTWHSDTPESTLRIGGLHGPSIPTTTSIQLWLEHRIRWCPKSIHLFHPRLLNPVDRGKHLA
ncbi:hypothetical protein V8G54_034493 [Vigna mungo]|uniref:Uncharacterized protein n=1 Tax=Vigna mungo TaxID=3915 RepID=A0AAQ3MQS2_VIGMU